MIKVGEAVTWIHVPRGGYCFGVRVPGTIVRATGRQVRVAVRRASGEIVEREVSRERLRVRCRWCHGARKAIVRDGVTGHVKDTVLCGHCDKHGEQPMLSPRAASEGDA